ncbi:nitrous oxide reductase accessory protein NosL [Geomesophilobacter sediminis]|uniref:Nitrous oxide reductase accessory protein NosL n=1 Tax=Geomesophilobacter sediminis TaxID=2798584 RepID=A0A8J7LV36_9BACT|nr:nitrous oxide reductase accessory protein NosL [Geomesophilobacter sediminis]MBJ6724495.1 nitrous oxide reductase accessory protein NosL [Geomesophilobacter sediminis]
MRRGRIWFLTVLAFTLMAGVTLWADDIADHRSCAFCGMDRLTYGYSRALVRFADGTQEATCSLNCAVFKIDEKKQTPVKELLVADHDTRQLVAAAKAYWVIGGDERGVMTRRPKWAFADQRAAEHFVQEHGGSRVDWEKALHAAREDAGLE